jgi:hypothetical protein
VHAVEQIADRCHHLDVGALVPAAHIISLAHATVFDNEGEGPRVVFDIEPVPDVSSVAIDR